MFFSAPGSLADTAAFAAEDFLASNRFAVERHLAEPMDAAHWHDHVEINLLVSGRMTYLFNGRQVELDSGRLALFWAAIPHRTIHADPETQLICIYLPLVQMLDLPIQRRFKQQLMEGSFMAVAEPNPSDTGQMMQWVSDWESNIPSLQQLVGDEVRLRVRRMTLSPIITHTTGDAGQSRLGPDQLRLAQKLVDLINLHYAEQLSLTLLSNMAKVHQSTASAAFKSVFGVSVHEYLTRYRLAQAMHRLADTDDPILDVAFGTGFGSVSRFYDTFKTRTGQTPRQFRQRVRMGLAEHTPFDALPARNSNSTIDSEMISAKC